MNKILQSSSFMVPTSPLFLMEIKANRRVTALYGTCGTIIYSSSQDPNNSVPVGFETHILADHGIYDAMTPLASGSDLSDRHAIWPT